MQEIYKNGNIYYLVWRGERMSNFWLLRKWEFSNKAWLFAIIHHLDRKQKQAPSIENDKGGKGIWVLLDSDNHAEVESIYKRSWH